MAAVKQVDPNFVLKKKNGKDEEVQEGWKGHVFPFDLVQKTMLPEELAALKAKEDKLNTITGEYDSLLEELSEDDKSQPFVNDAGDAFVVAEVKKAVKAQTVEAETLAVLKKVQNLIDEEKNLKKEVKDSVTALHLKTKKVIEELTDEQANTLLKQKWIIALAESINSLPDAAVNGLISKLEAICKKYETTFADVEKEIADTEQSLIAMLDELEGNEFDMQGIAELKALLGGK